jgi:hypothetical protein
MRMIPMNSVTRDFGEVKGEAPVPGSNAPTAMSALPRPHRVSDVARTALDFAAPHEKTKAYGDERLKARTCTCHPCPVRRCGSTSSCQRNREDETRGDNDHRDQRDRQDVGNPARQVQVHGALGQRGTA